MTSTSSSNQSTDKSNKATLTWEIDNFASLNSSVTSPTFAFANDDKFKFILNLYPKSNTGYIGDHTSIFLTGPSDGTFYFAIWIINKNGEKCLEQEVKVQFIKSYLISGFISLYNDYLRNSANELLVNGKLTIYCEVNKIEDKESIIPEINSNKVKKQTKISKDLESLLENENFSDAVFVVGKKEFRVHKAILAARSSVFKAMFEHECEEKKQNRVEIIDLDVEVCEEFLGYIYTGNVTSLDRFAPELMAAADKYQLDELKSACEQFLCKSLDIGSVASVLQLADMHNAEQLKSKCIEYITANAKDLQDTEGWKKLFIAKPELGFQLFLNVANRK